MKSRHFVSLIPLLVPTATLIPADPAPPDKRPRLREAGIRIGVLPPGRWNAFTDVRGVKVGQVTLREGRDVRTGVTAVLPHGKESTV
jgi:D-aminopeptidase